MTTQVEVAIGGWFVERQQCIVANGLSVHTGCMVFKRVCQHCHDFPPGDA